MLLFAGNIQDDEQQVLVLFDQSGFDPLTWPSRLIPMAAEPKLNSVQLDYKQVRRFALEVLALYGDPRHGQARDEGAAPGCMRKNSPVSWRQAAISEWSQDALWR